MKSLKVLCAVGMLSLLFSCAQNEDTVAFFIKNEINDNLTIESLEKSSDPNIFRYTELTLKSSEEYRKYIQRLRDVEITRLVCDFKDYQGVIHHGKLFIDGVLLGEFKQNTEKLTVQDFDTLRLIAEKFLEKTSLEFYFKGESTTEHYLSVDIVLEIKGTFVH